MIPARILLAIAIAAVVTGAPIASAQEARPPRDLWSEFPLEPTQTTEAPAAQVPLTPPTPRVDPSGALPGVGADVTSDETSARWLWTALIMASGLGVLVFVSIRRRLVDWGEAHAPSELPRSRARALVVSLSSVAEHAGLRPATRELRRFSFGVDPDTDGLGPCVIHRLGLVRRRFVAEAVRADQDQRRIASSRAFWRFLGSGRKVWGELIDDLKLAGWEPVPTWGAQPGDPIEAGDAWYEVQLVRADRHAVVDAAPESARESKEGNDAFPASTATARPEREATD